GKLLADRTFPYADNRGDFIGIVIDDIMAKKAFPGESAIGKRLFIRSRGQEAEWNDVIGVVEHERHESLATPGREAVFLTDGYFGNGAVGTWVLRLPCAGGEPCDPTRVASEARKVVAAIDPKVPVADIQPMQAIVDRAETPTRFALVLIGVFAAVAAVFACVGLYGVLATAVRQRTGA